MLPVRWSYYSPFGESSRLVEAKSGGKSELGALKSRRFKRHQNHIKSRFVDANYNGLFDIGLMMFNGEEFQTLMELIYQFRHVSKNLYGSCVYFFIHADYYYMINANVYYRILYSKNVHCFF